ncbi:metal-dependent amidase/aminoacylase/carboxypeptidase family protein, partial [Bradyrhizobium sp. LB8.2]
AGTHHACGHDSQHAGGTRCAMMVDHGWPAT